MKIHLRIRQPIDQTARSLELMRRWNLGLDAVDGEAVIQPAVPLYRYMSECECPFDCPRDHEND